MSNAVQVSKPSEITIDDLHRAYLKCRLRQIGYGMARVIETPAVEIALRNTAIAMKKERQLQLDLKEKA